MCGAILILLWSSILVLLALWVSVMALVKAAGRAVLVLLIAASLAYVALLVWHAHTTLRVPSRRVALVAVLLLAFTLLLTALVAARSAAAVFLGGLAEHALAELVPPHCALDLASDVRLDIMRHTCSHRQTLLPLDLNAVVAVAVPVAMGLGLARPRVSVAADMLAI